MKMNSTFNPSENPKEVNPQKEDQKVRRQASLLSRSYTETPVSGKQKSQSYQGSMKGMAAKNRYKRSVQLKRKMFFISCFERT